MIKGLCSATVAPSITLYTLGSWDANQGFCGTSDQYNGWYHAYLFVMIWVVSDFYEWGYHQLGHRYAFFWQHHRHHHKFYNPSPFAVIADEYVVCIASALDVAWALPRGLVRTRAGLPAAAATVSQTSFSSRRSPHALTDLLTLIPRLSRWPRRVCVYSGTPTRRRDRCHCSHSRWSSRSTSSFCSSSTACGNVDIVLDISHECPSSNTRQTRCVTCPSQCHADRVLIGACNLIACPIHGVQVFFYGYGTYLHFGYEIDAIDAHNKYILSSYQHYLHHAVSIKNKT